MRCNCRMALQGTIDLTSAPIPHDFFPYTSKHAAEVAYDPAHTMANEPLVSLNKYAVRSQPYERRRILSSRRPELVSRFATRELWVRRSVAEKLAIVNTVLSPLGIEL